MLSRPHFFWFYYPACWLAVLTLVLHSAFLDWKLLKPINVGGTLMGGMNDLVFAGGWLLTTLALLLSMLLRLPGSIHACIVAGLLPLGIGTWWQVNYPAESDELIYSISRGEIGSAMLTGGALLALGLFLRSRLKNNNPASRPVLIGQCVVALLIASVFIGAPLRIAMQRTLPNCAFNKDGQQLTVCLSDDENERVFVDD